MDEGLKNLGSWVHHMLPLWRRGAGTAVGIVRGAAWSVVAVTAPLVVLLGLWTGRPALAPTTRSTGLLTVADATLTEALVLSIVVALCASVRRVGGGESPLLPSWLRRVTRALRGIQELRAARAIRALKEAKGAVRVATSLVLVPLAVLDAAALFLTTEGHAPLTLREDLIQLVVIMPVLLVVVLPLPAGRLHWPGVFTVAALVAAAAWILSGAFYPHRADAFAVIAVVGLLMGILAFGKGPWVTSASLLAVLLTVLPLERLLSGLRHLVGVLFLVVSVVALVQALLKLVEGLDLGDGLNRRANVMIKGGGLALLTVLVGPPLVALLTDTDPSKVTSGAVTVALNILAGALLLVVTMSDRGEHVAVDWRQQKPGWVSSADQVRATWEQPRRRTR